MLEAMYEVKGQLTLTDINVIKVNLFLIERWDAAKLLMRPFVKRNKHRAYFEEGMSEVILLYIR